MRHVEQVPGFSLSQSEAGTRHHCRQVVAFGTKRIWTGASATGAEVRTGKDVLNRRTWSGADGDLAEFVSTFQYVTILRTVGTIWPLATKFPILVTIVTIRAEDSSPGA